MSNLDQLWSKAELSSIVNSWFSCQLNSEYLTQPFLNGFSFNMGHSATLNNRYTTDLAIVIDAIQNLAPHFFHIPQQARTWKVLRIGLRDFWSIFPLILIKTNQLTPLLKKSYHSKFFMFFQVVKFTFWYGISMNLKVMLLIIKQIESCKKLQKLNFWPYLDDF